MAFGNYWKFTGGTAPTLTTTASAVDVIAFFVDSSTRITAQVLLNVSGFLDLPLHYFYRTKILVTRLNAACVSIVLIVPIFPEHRRLQVIARRGL